MTIIPKNYLLRNKATKLCALITAVAEYARYYGGSDTDDDSETMSAESRRKSAQMDFVDFDELEVTRQITV